MIFDDEKKCLELGYKVLRHYEDTLGADCSLRLSQLSENVTYFVENRTPGKALGEDYALRDRTDGDDDSRAVLRLCRPGYHTLEELRAEMAWMEELGDKLGKRADDGTDAVCGSFVFDRAGRKRKGSAGKRLSGVSFRQPIRSDAGDYLCVVEDDLGQDYYGAVFTYLPGIPLEELSAKEQIFWFEKLGEATAFLHRQAKERDYGARFLAADQRHFPRFHWNYESMIGRNALWGDWRKALPESGGDGAGDHFQYILEQADNIIRHKLQAYGISEDTYGLIHGDLRGANLLVSGDTLGIIDFDDCGYGWYMQDLAASLSFMETREEVPKLIRSWCRGYRKRGMLREEDLSMIGTFIMMRRLQLLSWIETRGGAASARRYHDNFLTETIRLADNYRKQDVSWIE